MPRDMFGDVVDPSIKVGSQKWYTVPLSIAVHTAVIGAVVIIPLMAAPMLPGVPQMMAFAYYQLSWIMYAINPTWSYRLNADFEDHAEHEYALLVDEHPEWEHTPFVSEFHEDFGHYDSLADLFRQIGYDERLHRLQSESAMKHPRFR